MPVWASVLITVLAGLGAGFFGSWLTVWSDRNERFRDRMIEAADDFGASASEALIGLRDAIGGVRLGVTARELGVGDAEATGTMQQSVESAWALRDAVLKKSTRLDLLFGPDSKTVELADTLLEHLADATTEALKPPEFDLVAAEVSLGRSAEALKKFHRVAYHEIKDARPPAAGVFRSALRRTQQG